MSDFQARQEAVAEDGIQIDPEFKALIPPLTDAEQHQLGESLNAEGCRDLQ